MKTKTILFFILSLFIFSQNIGQNIELTFTAEYNSQHIQLDSIYIKNLSQGSDTVLYYPDTVLIISNVGMHEFEILSNQFSVSQNYPNPFAGETSVNVYLPKDELISVSIFDLMGRKLASYENNLSAGNHMFTFYPCANSFYFFSVATKHVQKTIKMLCSDTKTYGQCKLVYGGMTENQAPMKTEKSYFVFSNGDLLSFTGYATIAGNKGSGFIDDIPNNNEFYVFDIGEDGIPCPEMPFVTDIDGNVYQTVRIGSQCWMKENLKTTRYRDGTAINYPGSGSAAWTGDTVGAYSWVFNDTAYKHIYGALYNWYAVDNHSGLCPPGWHVPTDEEWCRLENYIERNADPDCNMFGIMYERGENTGRILKSCLTSPGPGIAPECESDQHPGWNYYNNVTFGYDTYGFSALPAGWRVAQCQGSGSGGHWWTHTEHIDEYVFRIIRIMYNDNASINRSLAVSSSGLSVRCLRD